MTRSAQIALSPETIRPAVFFSANCRTHLGKKSGFRQSLCPEATQGEIAMDAGTVYKNIQAISADFAAERRERPRRRELVAADFAAV